MREGLIVSSLVDGIDVANSGEDFQRQTDILTLEKLLSGKDTEASL